MCMSTFKGHKMKSVRISLLIWTTFNHQGLVCLILNFQAANIFWFGLLKFWKCWLCYSFFHNPLKESCTFLRGCRPVAVIFSFLSWWPSTSQWMQSRSSNGILSDHPSIFCLLCTDKCSRIVWSVLLGYRSQKCVWKENWWDLNCG